MKGREGKFDVLDASNHGVGSCVQVPPLVHTCSGRGKRSTLACFVDTSLHNPKGLRS